MKSSFIRRCLRTKALNANRLLIKIRICKEAFRTSYLRIILVIWTLIEEFLLIRINTISINKARVKMNKSTIKMR